MAYKHMVDSANVSGSNGTLYLVHCPDVSHPGGFLARCGLRDCCFLGCNAGFPGTLRIWILHLFKDDFPPSDCSESAVSLESESVSEGESLNK